MHRRTPDAEEAERYRALEREWQNEIGHVLLDVPHAVAGAALVFQRQFDRIIDRLSLHDDDVVVEVGCGRGHFLSRLRERCERNVRLIGMDISRAVEALPSKSLLGVKGDGAQLPFRDGSLAAIVYDGALHHIIDYDAALERACCALRPGGALVIFEPVSSRFSRAMHRLLDPIVFRKCVYESPIDQRYKADFHEERVLRVLRAHDFRLHIERSDFLAYPFTGCYAGSAFARRERLMQRLLAVESLVEKTPLLGRIALALSWRVLVVATKPTAPQ